MRRNGREVAVGAWGSSPRRWLLLLLGLGLAACGRKGPLRLPEPEDEEEAE